MDVVTHKSNSHDKRSAPWIATIRTACGASMRVLMPALGIIVGLMTWGSGAAVGQQGVVDGEAVVVVRLQPGRIAANQTTEDESDTRSQYENGAALKTDPELMVRLDKATQYQRDGNFRVASRLWQSVLDESGDTLWSDDGETYFSLALRIEAMLRELPPEGLEAYRIAADASAAEILALGDGSPESLGTVVRRYFLSSRGDDAAWQLGCHFLDRSDYSGALRMFLKIVEGHPDPDIPRDQVWMRIAVAYASMGESDRARQAIEQAETEGIDTRSRLYEQVLAWVNTAPALDSDTPAARGWSMALGNASRTGLMASVPDPATGRLRAVWQHWYEPRDTYTGEQFSGNHLEKTDPDAIANSLSRGEETLIKSWREHEWRPAQQMLFQADRAYWKSGADLVAFSTGVAAQPKPSWRSLWLNRFEIDNATFVWRQLLDNYGRITNGNRSDGVPTRAHEVQLFGDAIAGAMSCYQGVIYSIEGEEYSPWTTRPPSSANQNRSFAWGSVPRRIRTNYLTAYDAETGLLLWRQPGFDIPGFDMPGETRPSGEPAEADSETNELAEPGMATATEPFLDTGFMGAPVGVGDLIIAPMNVSGAIWLYAMDPARQGELVWRAYLCDEPVGGSVAWSPIQLSVDGSSLYASCGTGVIFSVDALTGMIRFARRYPRTGEPNSMMARFGSDMELLDLDGWREDVVIPRGNVVMGFSSDYNAIIAIDRNDASFVWRTDNRPFGQKFDHVIGVYGDYLYIGGRDVVGAVSIQAQGRWAWLYSLPEAACGRGMLTEKALYVPSGNNIIKLDLNGDAGEGKVLASWPVTLGTGAPVGNLYSDGEKFWVDGGNRLYALGEDTRSDDIDTEGAESDAERVGEHPPAESRPSAARTPARSSTASGLPVSRKP